MSSTVQRALRAEGGLERPRSEAPALGIASAALGLIATHAGLDSVFLVSTGVVLASVFVALRLLRRRL
jgi:hypothetical protein